MARKKKIENISSTPSTSGASCHYDYGDDVECGFLEILIAFIAIFLFPPIIFSVLVAIIALPLYFAVTYDPLILGLLPISMLIVALIAESLFSNID